MGKQENYWWRAIVAKHEVEGLGWFTKFSKDHIGWGCG